MADRPTKYLMLDHRRNKAMNGLMYSRRAVQEHSELDYTTVANSEDETLHAIDTDSMPNFDDFKPKRKYTGGTAGGGTQPTNSDGVKYQDKYKIGDTTITITDPYGIRSFAGREGQHSTGVDMITSSGKVVAIRDGVIESVKLEGDGSVIEPTQGSTAGYYIEVRHSDGTKAQYMHLDPPKEGGLAAMKKSLEGKKLTRGDEIWGYTTGSGSMTGLHFKFRLYKGNSKNHMDPSKYFR